VIDQQTEDPPGESALLLRVAEWCERSGAWIKPECTRNIRTYQERATEVLDEIEDSIGGLTSTGQSGPV